MYSKTMMRIQAATLALALIPAGSTFAATRHHKKHHSRTRGTVVGAVAGAAIVHKKPVQGAVIGAVVGNAVQDIRNKH